MTLPKSFFTVTGSIFVLAIIAVGVVLFAMLNIQSQGREACKKSEWHGVNYFTPELDDVIEVRSAFNGSSCIESHSHVENLLLTPGPHTEVLESNNSVYSLRMYEVRTYTEECNGRIGDCTEGSSWYLGLFRKIAEQNYEQIDHVFLIGYSDYKTYSSRNRTTKIEITGDGEAKIMVSTSDSSEKEIYVGFDEERLSKK